MTGLKKVEYLFFFLSFFICRSPIEFVRPFVSQTSQDVPKPPKKPLAAFFEFKAIKKEEIMKNNPGDLAI